MHSHYGQVAGAFDRASENYDELYQDNGIMAWLRAESLAALVATFPPGSRLLEIGCGTGEEALALSRAGYHIVATDISPAMIDTARTKTGAEGVDWHVLPAGQIGALAGSYGAGSFDGAYSSFGALNCEPQLAPVAAGLARLLRPGGRLVCSVMNRCCAWEIVWGLLHLRPRQAFRRLGRGSVPAGLASPGGRLAVPTFYHSPRTFSRAFAPHFAQQVTRGLPVCLPPPYLAHLAERQPGLFARLEAVERRLRERYPFHSLGDHFLVTLVRAPVQEAVC